MQGAVTKNADAPFRFVDARLVPLAISLWLSCAVVVYIGSSRHPVLLQLWLLLLGVASFFAVHIVRTRFISLTVVATMSVLGIGLGTVLGVARVIPLTTGPLASIAQQHSVLEFHATVQSDPSVTTKRGGLDWSSAQQTSVAVRLVSVAQGGHVYRVRVPALLFASYQRDRFVRHCIPGMNINGYARVDPARVGRPYAVYLTATSLVHSDVLAPRYQFLASRFRDQLVAALVDAPAEVKQLVPGLALGDTRAISTQLTTDMRTAGLTHLIAVSGANVTILLLVVLALVRRRSLRLQTVVAIMALAAFVVVVRPQPSVLRAAVMGVVVLIGTLMRRRIDGIAVLASAIVLLLVLDPFLSVSYGFALSVAATAGLMVWSHSLRHYLDGRIPRQIPAWLLDGFVVTTCAQLAVAPLLIGMGSQLSLASLPANLICVPLATVVMLTGLVVAALAVVSLPIAQLFSWITVIPAWLIAHVAHVASSFTWLVIPWPHGLVGVIACLLVMGVCLYVMKAKSHFNAQQQSAVVTALVLFFGSLWFHPHVPGRMWPPQHWTMVSCDVGQGDATVLNVAPHQAIVIDAGGDAHAVDQCLTGLRVTSIPLLVLTHFHADHVGGLVGVLHGRQVGSVRTSPLFEPALTFAFATHVLDQHHLSFRPITAGEQLHVGNIHLQCLWPSRIIHGQGSDPNNASIVLLAQVGGHRYLLAGDVESPAQKAIVEQYHLTHVDVLKVAHHGSRNQDVEFAKALQPTIGFISVGAHNDYGHPAAETIELYQSLGTHIFRTDLNGGLAVVDSSLAQFGLPQPGPNKPGPNKPGPNKPGPNKPGPNKPGSNKPGPQQGDQPSSPKNSTANDTNGLYLEVVTAH